MCAYCVSLRLELFIRQHMGTGGPDSADAESLRLELTELQQKHDLLLEENKELRRRVRANANFPQTV
ncbi:hypothetical protein NFI96_005173 [Prochilodus magdalenae]|nr:hypothetical protein NFI96_005173 [Prochilodus magdalenae]